MHDIAALKPVRWFCNRTITNRLLTSSALFFCERRPELSLHGSVLSLPNLVWCVFMSESEFHFARIRDRVLSIVASFLVVGIVVVMAL